MSTEKVIRLQSKKSLNGNWIVSVSGVFVLLAVIFLIEVFYYSLIFVTGIVDENGIKKGAEPVLVIIISFTLLFYFALTPFKNGFFRLFYNIADGRSDGLRDVFYFFSGIKPYFKALGFNVIITLKKALYALIGFIPYIICLVFEQILFKFITPTTFTNQVFDIVETGLIVIGVTITLIISIRLIIAEFVFVDNFESNAFVIAKGISKRHLSDYYKLILSFIPWILSCLFVLPWLYVIPYLTTSLGTTSKWLINLYKEGKTV